MDFKNALNRQLGFLRVSCAQYDAGNKEEAIRIGTTLRVLFHDTKSSISLLTHLNAKNIKLLSTATPIPPGVQFSFTLTNIEADPATLTFDSIPKLDTSTRNSFVTFDKWWDGEVVYLFTNGRKIRRSTMVKYAANKDGGAHVDATLPAEYIRIIEGFGWSFSRERIGGAKKEVTLRNSEFAPLRQMAYEVLNSPALIQLAT